MAPADIFARLLPQLSPGALDGISRAAQIEEHPARTTLCCEGSIEDSFYIVVEGRVDVFKQIQGQMRFVNHLTSGAYFGDIALLLDVPRTATIVTAETTRVWRIRRGELEAFTRAHPEVRQALTQMIIRRFLAQEEKHLLEIARLKKRDVPPPRIFVSYARTDEAFVTPLANSLLKQDIDLWLDIYRIEPGTSWARQIGEALDACQLMLLVLSPASVASENAEDEWNYYLDAKKPVVVVRHAPCKIPYRLSKLEYVDFHHTDYEQALARLAATLNTIR